MQFVVLVPLSVAMAYVTTLIFLGLAGLIMVAVAGIFGVALDRTQMFGKGSIVFLSIFFSIVFWIALADFLVTPNRYYSFIDSLRLQSTATKVTNWNPRWDVYVEDTPGTIYISAPPTVYEREGVEIEGDWDDPYDHSASKIYTSKIGTWVMENYPTGIFASKKLEVTHPYKSVKRLYNFQCVKTIRKDGSISIRPTEGEEKDEFVYSVYYRDEMGEGAVVDSSSPNAISNALRVVFTLFGSFNQRNNDNSRGLSNINYELFGSYMENLCDYQGIYADDSESKLSAKKIVSETQKSVAPNQPATFLVSTLTEFEKEQLKNKIQTSFVSASDCFIQNNFTCTLFFSYVLGNMSNYLEESMLATTNKFKAESKKQTLNRISGLYEVVNLQGAQSAYWTSINFSSILRDGNNVSFFTKSTSDKMNVAENEDENVVFTGEEKYFELRLDELKLDCKTRRLNMMSSLYYPNMEAEHGIENFIAIRYYPSPEVIEFPKTDIDAFSRLCNT